LTNGSHSASAREGNPGKAMSFLVEPISRVMKRLTFAAKFCIVGAVFVAPLLLTAAMLLMKLNDELAFAREEQRGAEYTAAVTSMLSALQRHRALQSGLLNGDTSLRDAAQQARTEVDQAVAVVHETDARNADFGLTKDWAELRERWESIKKEAGTTSARASTSAHTAIAAGLTALLASISACRY
jgi:hypothetical protein